MNTEEEKELVNAPIVPIVDKYLLTIKQASSYFNIGEKRLRRLAEDGLGDISIYCGNRYLIVRPRFEEFVLINSKL